MKNTLKSIIFWLVKILAPHSRKGAVILMYHSVSDSASGLAVSAASFERQMKYLRESGYECVALSELDRRRMAGEPLSNLVCVTFDDGYVDNSATALPVLRKHGVSATLFVITGLIGKSWKTTSGYEFPMLQESQLRSLASDGFLEIMPHGHMHADLSSLEGQHALAEVRESRTAVEAITGKVAVYFAYPFGTYASHTIEILKSLGFRAAVTVKEGEVTSASPAFELPRMSVGRDTSFSEFVCKVSRPAAYLSLKKIFGRS